MQIIKSGNDFKLFIKNHEILNSTQIHYGKGKHKFKENHGHFKIKEKVKVIKKENIDLQTKLVSKNISEILIDIPQQYNRINITFSGLESEKIYGGGEQYTHLNLKGKKFPLWVQEQGVGRGHDLISFATKFKGISGSWYTTYFPSPIFLSTFGYALIFETYSPMIVNLKGKDLKYEIWDNTLKIIIIEGENLTDLAKEIRDYFDIKHHLPEWIHGTIIASQGGIESLDRKMKKLKENDVPVSAFWCQDWSGTINTSFGKQVYWNWEYDDKSYKALPEEIKRLNNEGIKFLSYINPFLIEGSRLYNIAKENNYFVRNSSNEVYKIYVTSFPAGLIDLTNKNAYEWYKEIIKNNIINIGITGWMADFGEYLPVDAVLSSGENVVNYHNRYPVDWAKLNYEAIKESHKKDLTFFMRSGYFNSVSYCPIYWAGDQNVNWSKSDGLSSVVPAALSVGLSGVDFFHWDAGGYTSLMWMKRTPELFMRWIELSSFSLIMRTHEGNRPYKNVQFDSDEKIFKHFIRMSRVHYSLKNYLKKEITKSLNQKLPVIKHLCLNYPEDKESLNQKYEYLLGDDILVAPILEKGKKEKKVYLPPDKWIHLWTNRRFLGGEYIKVKADLGFPPIFIKQDSPFLEEIFSEIESINKKLK